MKMTNSQSFKYYVKLFSIYSVYFSHQLYFVHLRHKNKLSFMMLNRIDNIISHTPLVAMASLPPQPDLYCKIKNLYTGKLPKITRFEHYTNARHILAKILRVGGLEGQ